MCAFTQEQHQSTLEVLYFFFHSISEVDIVLKLRVSDSYSSCTDDFLSIEKHVSPDVMPDVVKILPLVKLN